MKTLQSTLYCATSTATGGREGTAKSSDGKLSVTLSTPKALGGDDGQGTNPEQLFAAGYAACFIGALKFVAGAQKQALPKDVEVQSQVSIGPIEHGFGIAVAMQVHIPGFELSKAQELVDAAHQVCPYSNATRGNIEVTLTVR